MNTEQARRKTEDAAFQAEKVETEMAGLAGAPERYLQIKENGIPETLEETVQEAFTPAARVLARRCLTALEKARNVDREEAHGRESRRLEYFGEARPAAQKLHWILSQLPEPEKWRYPYLQNPDGFLLMVTNYSRGDRLNAAINQVRSIQSKLKNR